ncbi:MAG: chloride channel protein [Vicinamibacterales bacterium]
MDTQPTPARRPWTLRRPAWTEAERIQRHQDHLLLLLTLLIGAVVGLVIVAFILVTERLGSHLYPADGAAWRRLAMPVAGALISGLLLARYFPGARGSGIPQTKVALFLQEGRIRLSTVVGKFVCSSISLASGIALGREGPAVQVGGGIASVFGRRLGLGPRLVQSLVPVGTAAALAAAFNTPISAVLFTLEEILGDLHARVLGSVVISAATSWAVLHLVLGNEPLFHVPAYQLVHPLELGIYVLLGIVGGLVSVVFVKLLLGLRLRFLALPVRTRWIQPAAGGLLVGLIGWFVPDVLGVGYAHVGEALNGRMVLGVMALLLVLKVVATAACYGSGNAGGIFGPSLFIGAMLGGVVGSIAHGWLPDVTGSPGAYALVGMGTAFAGIIRAPMTSVIMIFEITRDYSIIVPLMIANLLSYFISERLQPESVYAALLRQEHIELPPTRMHAPAEDEGAADARPLERASPRVLLTTLLVGVVGLAALAGFLTQRYYSARVESAAKLYEAGNELFRSQRNAEAIEQYRAALSLSLDNGHRLALGNALAAAGRADEADLYLREVVRIDPDQGPAQLAFARLASARGRSEEAIAAYRASIDGTWPAEGSQARIEARFELADLLARTGAPRLAIAELLRLTDQTADPAALNRIGEGLLALGSLPQAVDVFRQVLRAAPEDVRAWVGVGESELARDDYRAARTAFERAQRFDPDNGQAATRLALSNEVLALDPTLVGLRARDRYARSLRLLEGAVFAVQACPGFGGTEEAASLTEGARKALALRKPPPSPSDAAEENARLARELWTGAPKACTSPAPYEALSRVFARFGQ